MQSLGQLENEIAQWPHITAHSHRFGGREFLFAKAEVGHIHYGGIVDIPFTRTIHDALLSEGLAEEHHWLPNSGWVTFRFRTPNELNHAVWLLRLSYLRYALKTANNPHPLLENESEELQLSSRFKA